MLLILAKKNIYNGACTHVATELIVSGVKTQQIFEDEQDLLYGFIAVLADEVGASQEEPLALIFPITYQHWLDDMDPDQKVRLSLNWLIDATQTITDKNAHYALRLDGKAGQSIVDEAIRMILIDAPIADSYAGVKQQLGDRAEMIVSCVDNYDELHKCLGLGFELFQGDFVLSVKETPASTLSTNKMGVLNLIAMLNDPDMDISKLSEVITKDSVLSYKLLQMVNSPVFRGMTEVKSIQQAIVRFGFGNLKKWVMMLNLCHSVTKPTSLVNLTLARAFMCQSLAESDEHEANGDVAYTVGLLSTLDAFMDTPMSHLLSSTPLADDIKKAILSKDGAYGLILQNVIDYQKCLLSDVKPSMVKIYINSSAEVNEILSILQEG